MNFALSLDLALWWVFWSLAGSAILASAAWIACECWKRYGAPSRPRSTRVPTAMLACVLASPLVAAVCIGSRQPAQRVTPSHATPPSTAPSVLSAPLTSTPAARAPSSLAPEGDATLRAVRQTLASLWFVCLALALLGIVQRHRRNKRVLEQLEPVHTELPRAALAAARRELGLERDIRLLVCDTTESPFVTGLREPAIVLPRACLTWTRRALDFVMLHECAHIARRDWIGTALVQSARATMFWHPATRAIVDCLLFERERCCDAIVIGATGTPRAYSETLLRLTTPPPTGDLRLAMRSHPLVRRIASILDKETAPMKTTTLRSFASLAAACAAVLALDLRASDPVLDPAASQPAAHDVRGEDVRGENVRGEDKRHQAQTPRESPQKPPRGIVLRMDRESMTIVVRVTSESACKPKDLLQVHRGPRFVAQARVLRTQGKTAHCSILWESKSAKIRVGDEFRALRTRSKKKRRKTN